MRGRNSLNLQVPKVVAVLSRTGPDLVKTIVSNNSIVCNNLLLLLLLLCLFQTSTLFASADRSETADYNNLGNFLSCFK